MDCVTAWCGSQVQPTKMILARQRVLSSSEVRASDLELGGSWVRISSGAQIFSVSSYGLILYISLYSLYNINISGIGWLVKVVKNTENVFFTPYFVWRVKGDRYFVSLVLLMLFIKVNWDPWRILCNCKWNYPYIFFEGIQTSSSSGFQAWERKTKAAEGKAEVTGAVRWNRGEGWKK